MLGFPVTIRRSVAQPIINIGSSDKRGDQENTTPSKPSRKSTVKTKASKTTPAKPNMTQAKVDPNVVNEKNKEIGKMVKEKPTPISELEEKYSEYSTGNLMKRASKGDKVKEGDIDLYGTPLTKAQADKINKMAEEMQKLTSSTNSGHQEVWRGMALPEGTDINSLFQTRSIYELDSLTSSTHIREAAKKFTDPEIIGEDRAVKVLLRIGDKRGITGHNSSSGEMAGGETTLPKGYKFRIMSKRKEGDTWVINLYNNGKI